MVLNTTAIVWPTERQTKRQIAVTVKQLLSHPNNQQKNADMTITAVQVLPDNRDYMILRMGVI